MSERLSSILVEGVVDAQGVEDVVQVALYVQYAQVAQVSCCPWSFSWICIATQLCFPVPPRFFQLLITWGFIMKKIR